MTQDDDGTRFMRRAVIAFAILEALVIALFILVKLDLVQL